MADPTYPLFSVFAFLGFFLSLVPLPWHLQAWNSGTCYFMIWSALACLNQFVNSVVWRDNALNPAPWWCEVSTRILMGASVGIPASSLCINRRLYHIANVQAVSITSSEKRRDIIIDTMICVLFPIAYLALQYVVQGHRFNVLEDIGCQPALYNTLLTYFISYMWPIVLGLISAVYCTLSLRCFIRRRVQFNQFLSSNKSISAGRYFRLMALATTEMLFTIPLASIVIWLNTTSSPIGPWVSWEDTHFAFSRMEQIPAIIWRLNPRVVVAIELTRWATPFCAFVFFAFFGFADEAKKHYKQAFWSIVKPFGFKPKTQNAQRPIISIGHFEKPKISSLTSSGILPPYSSSPCEPLPLKLSPSTISSFSATSVHMTDGTDGEAPSLPSTPSTITSYEPGIRRSTPDIHDSEVSSIFDDVEKNVPRAL